jgi:hypothetical protein
MGRGNLQTLPYPKIAQKKKFSRLTELLINRLQHLQCLQLIAFDGKNPYICEELLRTSYNYLNFSNMSSLTKLNMFSQNTENQADPL